MKIVNIVLALLFLLFAYFQLNDPDSLIWIIIYLYLATLAALAAFGKLSLAMIIPGLVIFGAYFLYLLPSVFEFLSSGDDLMNRMDADKMYIEQTREAGGLLIGIVALVFLLLTRKKTA